MDAEFWIQRWRENRIGFHLDEVNPILMQYLPALKIAPPATVFVPLCGKSVDMIWLRDQGYEVVGVEISPLAVEGFFTGQQLAARCETVAGLPLWQADGIRIWCADIFALRPEQLGAIDICYDRAALIAMPGPLRQKYVQHVIGLTRQAPQLLITLEYPQQQMAGPPFSVPVTEVAHLYGGCYRGAGAPVAAVDVLADHAHFAARGLTALHENVYLLERA